MDTPRRRKGIGGTAIQVAHSVHIAVYIITVIYTRSISSATDIIAAGSRIIIVGRLLIITGIAYSVAKGVMPPPTPPKEGSEKLAEWLVALSIRNLFMLLPAAVLLLSLGCVTLLYVLIAIQQVSSEIKNLII